MKKTTTLLALAIVFVIACNKKSNTEPTPTPAPTADVTAPVIVLKGNTNDTVSLNSSYADPGTTATDNKDGNISSQVVVSGTINKDLVGEYRLYYNVKDAAGNSAAQMTRYVYVANDADYLEGDYAAFSNCGGSGTGNYPTKVIASTTQNNKVSIGVAGASIGIYSTTLTVNSNAISFQAAGGNSFAGTGTVGANKKTITLNLTSGPSGPLNCSNNYTKP